MRSSKSRGIAASAAVVLLLAACSGGGGDDPTDNPTEDSSAPSGPIELTYWSWMADIELSVDAFNDSQDDIHVTLEAIPAGVAGGYAKFTNALAASNAPDVMTIEYDHLAEYVSLGAVQAIEEFVEPSAFDAYPTSMVDLVTLDGIRWGLPYDAAPMLFYYRQDILDAAGISVPRTWEEFEASAAALQQAQPGTYLGQYFPNEANVFAAFNWQAGAQWFGIEGDSWTVDIDNPTSQEVAEYWQRLSDQGLVIRTQSWSEEWAQGIKNGTIAGVIGATWTAANIAGNATGQDGLWRVAQLPSWDGVPATAAWSGSTFAITKDSEQAEAAAAFVTWMTQDPAGIEARTAGGRVVFPAYPPIVETAKANYSNPVWGDQDLYAEFAIAYDSLVAGWMWGPAMNDTLTAIVDAGAAGTLTDALAAAQSATVDALKLRGLSVAE